jgi:predicted SAM-dependent methyltransferase
LNTTVDADGRNVALRETLKRYPFVVWGVRRTRAVQWRGLRWASRLRRRTTIQQYLATNNVRKLQIGSLGNYLEGWLNTDIAPTEWRTVYLDAAQRFPIPSNSFDAIFAEHMFEHIPYKDGQHMLRECFRILKPGGRVRIVTPRLGFLFDMLKQPLSPTQLGYIRFTREQWMPDATSDEASFVINNMFYNYGHRFIYDERTLAASLAAAGFTAIVQGRTCKSDDPNFQDVDQHWKLVGREFNDLESMVFEAARPSA